MFAGRWNAAGGTRTLAVTESAERQAKRTLMDAYRGLRTISATATVMALTVVVSACGWLQSDAMASPTVCAGVGATVGGCDANQPVFSGDTCDEVAREFGVQLDERLRPILAGADVVDGEHKSVRRAHAEILLVSRVKEYLRSDDVALQCAPEEFLDAAEEEFSAELIETAGQHLFASEPRPYSEWREDLLRTLGAIEQASQ
jgi:hypothetical protein